MKMVNLNMVNSEISCTKFAKINSLQKYLLYSRSFMIQDIFIQFVLLFDKSQVLAVELTDRKRSKPIKDSIVCNCITKNNCYNEDNH